MLARRTATPAALSALLASALPAAVLSGAGCSDDPLSTGRQDSGVAAPDGGLDQPLQLQPGMRFVYRATLNFRSETNDESDSVYEIVFRIVSVDDKRSAGDSTITVTATGAQLINRNWTVAAGGDSWLAGLGPSDATDRVSPSPLVVHIAKAPHAPPLGARKMIPFDGVYFLDTRRTEALRTEFSTAFASLLPRAVDPSQHPLGRWALAFSGTDPEMAFYPAPVKKRDLLLEYDPRGFLVEARERLGDSSVPNKPNASFSLVLRSGP